MNNDKSKKNIFMVDDDEIHLLTAELCLKDGYNIFKASSGEEALRFLNKKEAIPDLIMLDIIMPNMDGWELFEKIKGVSFLKDIPILFLTAMNDAKEKEKALELGAAGYITKPLEITLLKNTIKEILEKSA